MNWYYVDVGGKQAGPVDDAGLDALAASGTVNGETLVWREGMESWQALRLARQATIPSVAGASAGGLPGTASGIGEVVCAECGGVFPATQTIRVGDARVCANCKPAFVQKMQEGLSVESPGIYRYAGFWIRFVAVFVDGLLIGVISGVIRFAVGLPIIATTASRGNSGIAFGVIVLVKLLQYAIAISYETFFIGKYGATLGKMACGLRVITADGTQVSYARALGRYFAKIVSGLTCMIGYIMAGFDEEKRALHDRMCNTRVIYK